jgi:hypothetical protein
MGTISDALGELEGKIYLHVNSTTHRCPNKTMKNNGLGGR